MTGIWTILNTVREWRRAIKTEHNPGVPLFERWRIEGTAGGMTATWVGSKEAFDALWEAVEAPAFPLHWDGYAFLARLGDTVITGIADGDRLRGGADTLADGRVKHEEFIGWREP